jgi:hypothetical protein
MDVQVFSSSRSGSLSTPSDSRSTDSLNGDVLVQLIKAQLWMALVDNALTVGRHLVGDLAVFREDRRRDGVESTLAQWHVASSVPIDSVHCAPKHLDVRASSEPRVADSRRRPQVYRVADWHVDDDRRRRKDVRSVPRETFRRALGARARRWNRPAWRSPPANLVHRG